MVKTIFQFFLLYLFAAESYSQDSTAVFIKREIRFIDSVSKVINENTKPVIYTFMGALLLKGEYNGLAYKKSKSGEIEKLKITYQSAQEEIFCLKSSVLKIIRESQTYYHIKNSFYKQDGLEISIPDLIKNLEESESILDMVNKLFP